MRIGIFLVGMAVALVGVFSSSASAGFGFGVTGGVKHQTKTLDQKVREKRASSLVATPVGRILIAAASSSSMTIVAGKSTSLVVSAYVLGASAVQLYDVTGGSPVKLGDMNDSGILGDQTAGDNIFSLRTTLNASTAGSATLRVFASSSTGATQSQDFSIRVVTITYPASELVANQMANHLFSTTQGLQQLATSIKNDFKNNIFTATTQQNIQKLDGIVAAMFVDFEGITNLDAGFGLLGIDDHSAVLGMQQIKIFMVDPTAPAVRALEQQVIANGPCTEQDLVAASQGHGIFPCDNLQLLAETAEWATGQPYNTMVTKDLTRSIIKQAIGEPVSVAGDGLSALFGVGELASVVIGKTLDTGTDVFVDWQTDAHGNQDYIVGQAQNQEQFSVPSGSHNLLFSFGGGNTRSVKENVTIPAQQTSAVNFAPGQLSVPLAPSGLSARAGAGLSIVLQWTDNSSIESGFKILRSADNITFSQVATVGKDIQSYTDSAIVANTVYYYKVVAYDATGDSPSTAVASASVALTQSAVQFTTGTIDGSSIFDAVSAAKEANGNIHVAYHDNLNLILKYARWNGVSWSTQTVDGAIECCGDYPASIAVDGNGNPQIAYFDYRFPNRLLKYARWTGTAWSTQTVDSNFFGGYGISIAIDRSGNPQIAYGGLYARWTGFSWNTQTVGGGCALSVAIALDANDNPSISSLCNPAGFGHFYNLNYASLTNAVWNIHTIVSDNITFAETQLALDGAGTANITYDGNYARGFGLSWSTQTVNSIGEGLHLALDSGGVPRISYNAAGILKYARIVGSSWNSQTVDVGGANAITLDTQGIPYIIYIGSANNLKFAKGGP